MARKVFSYIRCHFTWAISDCIFFPNKRRLLVFLSNVRNLLKNERTVRIIFMSKQNIRFKIWSEYDAALIVSLQTNADGLILHKTENSEF
jgi:hypothetical protein